MKNIIMLFQLLFLSNLALSQDFWELLPFYNNYNINSIQVGSAGEIFVGTVSGNQDKGLFRSTDSGQNWEKILHTGNFQIYSFAINTKGHIFVSTGGFYTNCIYKIVQTILEIYNR